MPQESSLREARPNPEPSAVEGISALPHNIEAEICLLGSMILDSSVIGDVLQIVERDSFYRPQHQLIYEALVALYDRRSGVDIVVLKEELARRNALDRIGGHDCLMTLIESVPTAANAEHYATIVKEKAILRNLMGVCSRLLRDASSAQIEPEELLDQAEHMIFDVVKRRTRTESIKIGDILRVAFTKISDIRDRHGAARMAGIPTGYYDLDDKISGLQESQLIIIAGRPSMGKTSLALNIAEHAGLVEQKPVVLFSLEMSAEAIVQNLLCSHARIPASNLRSGRISEEDFQKLLLAAGRFADAPIYVDDSSMLSALELRARARRYKSDFDVALIVVDYLQLMEIKGSRDSRQQEISIISRSLKALARELEVPVIALSQLSRAPETRDDRRPRLADLRESGAIEQDADVVILLYRDEYYEPNSSENKGKCEVIIAKQRSGPTGKIELTFLNEYMRFENLAPSAIRPPVS
ncbi:MAG: replicative DNA helicase [Planctomycetota bacterium]|nr:replicative DNA helicase [Planctomycetota bacterium]